MVSEQQLCLWVAVGWAHLWASALSSPKWEEQWLLCGALMSTRHHDACGAPSKVSVTLVCIWYKLAVLSSFHLKSDQNNSNGNINSNTNGFSHWTFIIPCHWAMSSHSTFTSTVWASLHFTNAETHTPRPTTSEGQKGNSKPSWADSKAASFCISINILYI